jgi:hypothetical protein
MFSADATSLNNSRNPRRRHRSSGEDQGTTNQAVKRRKRVSITPSTFDPPIHTKLNGITKNGDHTHKEQTPEPELEYEQHEETEKTSNLVVRTRSGRAVRDRKPTRHGEGTVLV